MIIIFPRPSDRYNAEYGRLLADRLEQAFGRTLSTESSSPYLLLTSPDESVWKITISNLGALAAVKLPKGSPIT